MIINKIAGIGLGTLSLAGAFVRRCISIHDLDFSDPEVSNELNRAWLLDEPANLDKFVKNDVDLNKQYLCSDQDYYND